MATILDLNMDCEAIMDKNDLQIPSSPYFPAYDYAYAQGHGQGSPPMVQERFQSVIGCSNCCGITPWRRYQFSDQGGGIANRALLVENWKFHLLNCCYTTLLCSVYHPV
ncbi:hypothetical protein LOK49_LG05G02723 [Camellia lanceoleosa]|uniref:Uncharacterized protein n=1 Tax=Camellia lanceoleosa TaxID=1840588 RepID=A0ACC0HW39_9ERIC|nr:hypothetical protein LOK49_LG05G02723 [Camellia lanceoleosa]